MHEGEKATADDLLTYIGCSVANWQIPDDVIFFDELLHTATGKIQKAALRERFVAHGGP